MFNKTAYINKLNRLLMSINIKIEEAPYQIEYFLYTQYGIRKPDFYLDDKRTWKYYINISGNYHTLDTPMYVYNRYTNSNMLLTVTNLNLYPDIRNELLEYGLAFNNLVTAYPLQEFLIKSILLPVDIDYAISSETGTILAYDSNMVDSNEYSLMSELQEYVYGFFGRYYIMDYALVDDLYIASVYTVLYSNLRLKIENIRLRNVFTYEANSYHIANFFKSHLDIDLELDILTPKVKMWLYKNLRYIERHTGKDKIFNLIIKKVLEDSNIGIGEINIIKEDARLNESTDIYSSSYISGDINFKTKELNNRYIINKNKTYDLEQIIKKELLLPENNKLDSEVIINNEFNAIKSEKYLRESTKIIELDDKITLRSRTLPELHVLVDNWFYYAFNNKYNHIADIKDDNTNTIYRVNAKQAALMLIKIFVSIIGEDNKKLKNFRVASTLRYEQGLKSSINRLFLDRGITDRLTNRIFDLIPNLPNGFNTVDSLKDYLLKVNDLNNVIWYSISNVGNAVISSTLKRLQDRLYKDRYIDLTIYGVESTIDELLAKESIDYVISDKYDYITMMKKLVKTFTGLGFNTTDEDTNDLERYVSLIKKITSYSLQVIYTPVISSSIESPYTAEEVIMLSRALITCTDAEFSPLEDFYGNFISKEFKWIDGSTVDAQLAEYSTPSCEGLYALNYHIDLNYYRSVNLLDIDMSINTKCLDLYTHEMNAQATSPKKTYQEAFLEIPNYLQSDLITSYSTMSSPLITDSKIDEVNVDMSINFTDLDLNTTKLSINAYNYDPTDTRVNYEMPMSLLYTNSEEYSGIVYTDNEVVSNIKDFIAMNMSIDITGLDLTVLDEIPDVIIFTGAATVVTEHVIITDTLIEDETVLTGIGNQRVVDVLGGYVYTGEPTE